MSNLLKCQDYIILDEGHKIKNTTKTSKNVRAIPAEHHFILTGTPVQNNLRVSQTNGWTGFICKKPLNVDAWIEGIPMYIVF